VIGTASFGRCTNLKSITLPSSIAFLGDRAFQYCPNLTDVYFKGKRTGIIRGKFVFCPGDDLLQSRDDRVDKSLGWTAHSVVEDGS
jgi:hypothetical protein